MTSPTTSASDLRRAPLRLVAWGILLVSAITLTQWICRSAISRDEMENIRWGQALTWGTEKHPPLFGWIHYGWVELFGRADLSTYVLEKVNFVVGLLLLHLIVRRLLGRERALMATTLTVATAYALLICLKYNATSAMWPVWAAYLFCLHRAWRDGNLRWWALTGLTAGLAVLTKYHSLLLIACSFGFLLADPAGRRRFADRRLWIGVAAGVVVLLPHAAWVIRHDAATIGYAVENVSEGSLLVRHLVEPVKYLAMQVVCLLPALFLLVRWHRRTEGPPAPAAEPGAIRFLFWHGPVLGLAPAVLSLLGGISLGSLWGMTSWGLFPAWALARFRIAPARTRVDAAAAWAAGLTSLVVAAYFLNTAFLAEQRDYKGAAAAVLEAWHDRYPEPLGIIGGEDRYYEGLGVYLPSHPDVFGRMDPAFHPLVDLARIGREGAVILVPASNQGAVDAARARFPVNDAVTIELPARREGIRRLREDRLVALFVAPGSAEPPDAPRP